MSTLPKIDLSQLLSLYAQLERQGIRYGLGAKAEGGRDPRTGARYNPRSTGRLSTPISSLDHLDCSGLIRYSAFSASGGDLLLPDGSQNQRLWCEAQAKTGEVRLVSYEDAARYMTSARLFLCFIRPGYKGCGAVGHVWWLLNTDADALAETFESYGGHGVGSRPWNAAVLRREVYSCYELPVK